MSGVDGIDSDEEEWGTEELLIVPPARSNHQDSQPTRQQDPTEQPQDLADDDPWLAPLSTAEDVSSNGLNSTSTPSSRNDDESASGEPMILVDLTMLDSTIHCRFDPNAVNNPERASQLRRQLENQYREISTNGEYLSQGTIIPCGSSVWREALIQLRQQRPGHYFAPLFPPKATTS